jgi:cation transport ATPase
LECGWLARLDLVVGDVILLASGSKIPADCIVISSFSLVVLEESIDLNASVIGDDNKVKKATIES